MKTKILMVLALAGLLIPNQVLAKSCQTSPSKGSPSHYRLIDGKKCWYAGRGVAKAELSWGKTNVVVAATPNRDAAVRIPVREHTDKAVPVAPRVNLAIADWTLDIRGMATPLSKQIVLISAIEQEATDYAVDAMCGEVIWGVCERGKRYGP